MGGDVRVKTIEGPNGMFITGTPEELAEMREEMLAALAPVVIGEVLKRAPAPSAPAKKGRERQAVPGALLTRQAAADYLGISLRKFSGTVQPELERLGLVTRIGDKPLFKKEDLARWADTQKGGGSAGRKAGKSGSSGSRTPADKSNEARAKQIRSQLTKSPRRSTPKLFLVGERKGR